MEGILLSVSAHIILFAITLVAALYLLLNSPTVTFNYFGGAKKAKKTMKKKKKKKRPEGFLSFNDIPVGILLEDVMPFLPSRRSDWNNLAIINRSTYQSFRSRSDLLPPWPRECRWPQDPRFVSDALSAMAPHGQRQLPEFLLHQKSCHAVWSRDGTQIASLGNSFSFWMANRNNYIHVVDQKLGHVKKWAAHGEDNNVLSIDFGDEFLVSSGEDCLVKKWGRKNNSYDCVAEWDHLIPKDEYVNKDDGRFLRDNSEELFFPLRVSPDSLTIVMMIRGRALIFSAADGLIRHLTQLVGYHATAQPMFFPNGESIAFGCAFTQIVNRSCIKVWREWNEAESIKTLVIPEAAPETRYAFHFLRENAITEFAISSDGLTLVSCGEEVLFWTFEEDGTAFIKDKLRIPDGYKAKSVSFLPSGTHVAVAGEGDERYDGEFSGFLNFFSLVDLNRTSAYDFSDVVNSIRYSSKGIGLYVSGDKATINPDLDVDCNDEDDADDEDEDVEYQPRTVPVVFDFRF